MRWRVRREELRAGQRLKHECRCRQTFEGYNKLGVKGHEARLSKTKSLVKRASSCRCASISGRATSAVPRRKSTTTRRRPSSGASATSTHGDKRMRTEVTFQGIFSTVTEIRDEGRTRETGNGTAHRLVPQASTTAWSRTIETVVIKIASRSRNRSTRSAPSRRSGPDAAASRATAQGEIHGHRRIGDSHDRGQGSHRAGTEKFNRTKKELIIDDTVRLFYPGPIRDAARARTPGTEREEYPGEVWLVERPVVTTADGDSDVTVGYMGLRQVCTWISRGLGRAFHGVHAAGARHWNQILLSSPDLDELLDFMQGDLGAAIPVVGQVQAQVERRVEGPA